jgi:hypothetical protein
VNRLLMFLAPEVVPDFERVYSGNVCYHSVQSMSSRIVAIYLNVN